MKIAHKGESATPQKKKVNPKEMLQQRRSYSEEIQSDLEKQGVDFFMPVESGGSLHIDTDYLSLPQNITECQTQDLGEYLNAFTQQKVYMRTLLGYAELMCEEARREYSLASDNKYKEFLGTKLSETAKEREVNSDPEVRPSYNKFVDYKNKVRLLNLNIASIEDIIFLISREVSRRTGDFNEESRSYNVSRR